MVQSNRESHTTFPWSGALSNSDSSDLDGTHLCSASLQERCPAVWRTESEWNTVLNKWSQIDRWITRQVWSIIFRTEVKYMHTEGGGDNWAGNNKAKKSSGKCRESKPKWVSDIVLLQKEKKRQIYYDCDNGSAWQKAKDVIILFYLAIVRF